MWHGLTFLTPTISFQEIPVEQATRPDADSVTLPYLHHTRATVQLTRFDINTAAVWLCEPGCGCVCWFSMLMGVMDGCWLLCVLVRSALLDEEEEVCLQLLGAELRPKVIKMQAQSCVWVALCLLLCQRHTHVYHTHLRPPRPAPLFPLIAGG